MRLLSAHPAVIAHQQYPLELRLFGDSIMNVRRTPERYFRFINDEELYYRRLEAGDLVSPSEAIDLYRHIAAVEKPTASYFLEKCDPGECVYRARRLHPETKFIFLVRDPRDTLLSARAFDNKRGFNGFLEKSDDSEDEIIDKYKTEYSKLIDNISTLNSSFVRYDELILAPRVTLAHAFLCAGLLFDRQIYDLCSRKVAAYDIRFHQTAPSPHLSVGRWAREIPQTHARRLTDEFREVLTFFGFNTAEAA